MKRVLKYIYITVFLAIIFCVLTASADIPSDAIVWNGHSYYAYTQKMDPITAKAFCEEQGGYMVTITSAEENLVATEVIIRSGQSLLAIGATDEGHEGTWVWMNGEPFTYSNWVKGEPNNGLGRGQNYAQIDTSGTWDDFYGGYDRFTDVKGCICEWDSTPTTTPPTSTTDPTSTTTPPTPTTDPTPTKEKASGTWNGHRYQIFDEYLTWKEAKAICEAAGGHLFTITSAAEQSFIEGFVEQNGTRNYYYMGMTCEGSVGTWRWITGESFEYTNWQPGEPDNYRGSQFYGAYRRAESAKYGMKAHVWCDVANEGFISDDLSYLHKLPDHFGYICEWDPTEETTSPTSTTTPEVTLPPEPSPEDEATINNGVYELNHDEKTAVFMGPEEETITNLTIEDKIIINNTTYKVTEIDSDACLALSDLLYVYIGKEVKVIGESAFANCRKLIAVTGGKNVTTIRNNAFKNCSAMTTFSIGKKIKTIGNYAFYGCAKMKKLTLGSNLEKIGTSAYQNCRSIVSITLESKVKKIGKKAFYGCSGLKTITVKTTKLMNSSIGSNAFSGIYSKATFKCPSSKLSAYKKLLLKKGAPKTAKFKK